MATFLVLIILLQTCLILGNQGLEERTLVVAAIRELFVENVIKHSRGIEVLTVGDRGGFAESITDEIIKQTNGEMSVQVTMNNNNNNNIRELKSPTIILLDSVQHFEELENWLPQFADSRGTWHKHLLYAPGLKPDDIITRYQTDPAISEVGFLVNYDGLSIELASAFWFTPQKCHENQIKTINKFSRNNGRWENSNFYPNKFENFHGCTITVGYTEQFSSNFTKNIFKVLAAQLNFKLRRIYFSFADFNLLDIETHMTETMSTQGGESGRTLRSAAVHFDGLTFIVPPGEPLTDLEKMFAAFDKETWIAIGATFIIALVVIWIINFMSIKVQNFVFGREVKTPTLNVLSIFLNGGQHRVPGRNFARYLLMLFIIWSLIFRTCYQSMMFQNMTTDMRHPRVKTVDELVDQNFTLIYELTYDLHWIEHFAKR
jgi:hypothetical protein